MFDKRLMALCPESRKYIAGNVILQFLDLCFNTVMITMIALAVQNLYDKSWGVKGIAVSAAIIAVTVILRFFTTKYAVRMSYLASRTVKQVMRKKIYSKLLRLGTSYREHASTAELVQESVEGVDQLESYKTIKNMEKQDKERAEICETLKEKFGEKNPDVKV